MQLSRYLLPLLLCPLFAAPALAGAPRYNMTILGSNGSTATAINNAGQVAGTLRDPVSGAVHAYLWQDGLYTHLASPINKVSAISPDGAIAGEVIGSNDDSYLARPAVYANGTTRMIPLLTPDARFNGLTGINSAGKVSGTQYINGEGYGYTSFNGVTTALPTLGGSRSYASGMNEAGVVAGAAETADGSFHAILHDDSGLLDLGTLGGSNWNEATDVNDAGTAVGYAEFGENYRAFIYANGALQPLGTFAPGGRSIAMAINNLDQVVGYGSITFLYSGGVTYDLNKLVPAGSGLLINTVYDINDGGQITGSACGTGVGCVGVLLSPVPEPATGLMLLAGLALLHRLRRARTLH